MRRSLLISFLLLVCPALFAHPHIWINSSADLIMDGQRIESVRIRWEFDEWYSSGYLLDFDKDGDGDFNAAEQRELYENAFSDLHVIDYYTFLKFNNRFLPVPNAVDFEARMNGSILSYEFSLPIGQRYRTGDTLYVLNIDPSIYIDYYMEEISSADRLVLTDFRSLQTGTQVRGWAAAFDF